MTWWVPAAIGAAGSVYSAISASNQNNMQKAFNTYNAQMGYNVGMANAQAAATAMNANAAAAMQAGRLNAKVTRDVALYNSELMWRVTKYNNSLYDHELSLLWDEVGLEVHNLEKARQLEHSAMRAGYAASGVVIDEGSPADVLAAQRAQEEMDKFVIRHQGDIQASRILNAQAQSLWEGLMESNKILFEGEMSALATEGNAAIQAAAASAQAGITRAAGEWTAQQQYQAGLYNAQMGFNQNQQQIGANFMSGLFQAGGLAAGAFYANRQPTVKTPTVQQNITASGSSLIGGTDFSYQWGTGFTGKYSLR